MALPARYRQDVGKRDGHRMARVVSGGHGVLLAVRSIPLSENWRPDSCWFFATFSGTPKITITELGITVDGHLGFSHSIQHVIGTDKHGRPVDRTVRVTDGYRKV